MKKILVYGIIFILFCSGTAFNAVAQSREGFLSINANIFDADVYINGTFREKPPSLTKDFQQVHIIWKFRLRVTRPTGGKLP